MSRADRFTVKNDEEIYSDFLTNMNPHPVSGTLLRTVNENAVSRSIRNLINTDRGERLYQPLIGSDIRKILFENISDATAELLSSFINDTIEKHEPRAKVLRVQVIPNEDLNKYSVSIVYMLVNKSDPVSVDIILTRVR